MVRVSLPGHQRDRAGEGEAHHAGHRLQAQGYAVLPAAEAKARQHHHALLVQVLLLDPDEIGLFDQEGVERRVGPVAAPALAKADGHRRRR